MSTDSKHEVLCVCNECSKISLRQKIANLVSDLRLIPTKHIVAIYACGVIDTVIVLCLILLALKLL
jgi:hypothetical protein